MAVDCLGICKYHTIFLSPNFPNFDEWPKLIYYNTGLEMTPIDIWNIADRACILERMFNLREGLKREDDWLADRYFDEPTKLGIPLVRGKSIDRSKFKEMIDEYYEYSGFDSDGVPRSQTLIKHGLQNEPTHQL